MTYFVDNLRTTITKTFPTTATSSAKSPYSSLSPPTITSHTILTSNHSTAAGPRVQLHAATKPISTVCEEQEKSACEEATNVPLVTPSKDLRYLSMEETTALLFNAVGDNSPVSKNKGGTYYTPQASAVSKK